MKTYSAKASEIKRAWHVIDAKDKILGKVAVEAASLLLGKHKPMFSRNLDVGDYVVVINASQVRVTGKKAKDKAYYRHSGYPGGFKSITFSELMESQPTKAVEYAVKGMLPHTRLGAAMMKKLRVYAGEAHPHKGQINPAGPEPQGS